MSFSFTAESFVRIVDEARRSETHASSHERQMMELVNRGESDIAAALTALADFPKVGPAGSGPYVRALQAQLYRSQEGLAAARQICIAATEARINASQFVTDLERSLPNGPWSATGSVRHGVLVVDDFEDTRYMVAHVLEHAGFVVRTATNGLEAIIAAYEMKPAVIVMDVSMPVLGGLEATRLIKTIDALRDVRVIAHTAERDRTDAAFRTLFEAVLEKPVVPAVVVETVRRYVPA